LNSFLWLSSSFLSLVFVTVDCRLLGESCSNVLFSFKNISYVSVLRFMHLRPNLLVGCFHH
jgi:hypothetical protein